MATTELALAVTPFDHSGGVPAYTSMRGVKLDASTGRRSVILSPDFPTVFVAESGEVEFDEGRFPRAAAVAWFRAVADYLEAHPVPDCSSCNDQGCPECSDDDRVWTRAR